MSDVTEQLSSTGLFQQRYDTLMEEREEARQLFCVSRLDLLKDAHRESGSELGLEEWILTEGSGHHARSNPWEHIAPASSFFGEEGFWQILFTDECSGYKGRRNFIEYFNGFLKEAGLKLSLIDIVTKVFFSR